MRNSLDVIKERMGVFVETFTNTMMQHSNDPRKEKFQEVVEQLCKVILLQAELLSLEDSERFQIQEAEYNKILEDYLPLFRAFRSLPRAHSKSTYEIALVSKLDTIIKSHCRGQVVE